MTERERLAKAPIVEAALDIVLVLPDTVDQARLAAFHERIADRYPDKHVRNAWNSQVEIKPNQPVVTRTTGGPDGYVYTAADGKQVVQVRKDGFTFSRLRPYEDWKTFCAEAFDLWEEFARFAKPSKVNRVGLRYINRLMLPLPIGQFKDYVATGPEIAADLPQTPIGLFLRIAIPFADFEATAIITEAIEEVDKKLAALPFILDIDVFRPTAMSAPFERLRPVLEQLRDVKDLVFFSSLTPKALELFK